MMKRYILIVTLVVVSGVSGVFSCSGRRPMRSTDISGHIDDKENLISRAGAVITSLRDFDMRELSRLVHPEKGCRFSPYTYVNESDLRFTPSEFARLGRDTNLHTWGSYDGTGYPINLTFKDYYKRFVYDRDFAHAETVGYNRIVKSGNTINNISQFYPGSMVVEYHFAGFDPQYAGMDWRSLRLVFEKKVDTWYLVGIVHDEWTI